jgi:hypothetical protein
MGCGWKPWIASGPWLTPSAPPWPAIGCGGTPWITSWLWLAPAAALSPEIDCAHTNPSCGCWTQFPSGRVLDVPLFPSGRVPAGSPSILPVGATVGTSCVVGWPAGPFPWISAAALAANCWAMSSKAVLCRSAIRTNRLRLQSEPTFMSLSGIPVNGIKQRPNTSD